MSTSPLQQKVTEPLAEVIGTNGHTDEAEEEYVKAETPQQETSPLKAASEAKMPSAIATLEPSPTIAPKEVTEPEAMETDGTPEPVITPVVSAAESKEPEASKVQELTAPKPKEFEVSKVKEPVAPKVKEPTVPKTKEPAAPNVKELAAPKAKEPVEEDDEESESEEELGELDGPPRVLEGKRDRKKTDAFVPVVKFATPHVVVVPVGTGQKLSDIPAVASTLRKTSDDTLKKLHMICYGTPGLNKLRKKNILQFCGFATDEERKRGKKLAAKVNTVQAKDMLRAFGLLQSVKEENKSRALTAAERQEKILEYLEKPHVTNIHELFDKKAAKVERKKGRSKTAAAKRSPRKRSSTTKKAAVATESDDESQEEKSSGDEKGSEDEDFAEEKVTKTKRKASVKRKADDSDDSEPKAKTSRKAPVKSPKKAEPKSPQKGGKMTSKAELSDSSEEEEEVVIGPSDDELAGVVRSYVMEQDDLTKVTMRLVIEHCVAHFSGFDVAKRKVFIKEAARKVTEERQAQEAAE